MPCLENARAADYILVTWDGPNDPDNPYNWPLRRKWTLTIMSGVITFLTMMNGTIITVAHNAISRDLHISDSSFPNSYWPVTSWAIGVGIFALFFLPLMEDFGVRWAFLGSYALFICFVIPQALAKNFTTLVVTRFFAGGFVAIVGNTCVSVAGNIWEDERGRTIPVSIYIVAYLSRSSMGPVVGAAIFQFLSWRWIGYIQLIWFVALFPIYAIEFRESRGSTILRQRATLLRSQGKRAYTKQEIDSGGEDKSIVDQVLKSAVRPLTRFSESQLHLSLRCGQPSLSVFYIFSPSLLNKYLVVYMIGLRAKVGTFSLRLSLERCLAGLELCYPRGSTLLQLVEIP
ncbi:uncharacterized protein N7484_010360 [Penicillium longicatenatum]|uniref:uncharacterized protein n=1 Tax=Penicillium longicatenatum TaxID=1561947 RepID=UPI002546D7D9|nr:uncharacterized protein N7484_010360 [Penicillium longicatenatum]KAJ5630260.1 hypothetical protein N7484_010360 [Penicillium longicatenatum]